VRNIIPPRNLRYGYTGLLTLKIIWFQLKHLLRKYFYNNIDTCDAENIIPNVLILFSIA